MKSKFLNFLTISAILLPLLMAVSGASSMSFKARNESPDTFDRTPVQNNPSSIKPAKTLESGQPRNLLAMQSAPLASASHAEKPHFSQPLHSEAENALKGGAVFLLVVAYIVGGIGYRRTRVLQELTLQQQIAMLERIWHRSPK